MIQRVPHYTEEESAAIIEAELAGSRTALVASSCNETATCLVQDFGQFLIVEEGERLDRADRAVRRGLLDRVEACTMEPSAEDVIQGDSGYAVAHVRLFPEGTWHFAPSTGKFVPEET